MKIQALGLGLAGKPVFPAMDEEEFNRSISDSLEKNYGFLGAAFPPTSRTLLRGEKSFLRLDPADPIKSGWTILTNERDPRKDQIMAALAPLAERRRMRTALSCKTTASDSWSDWLQDDYLALAVEGQQVPRYVLIAGGPDQVPFAFQSILDAVANVGRVDFDRIEDYRIYAEKIIRLEDLSDPITEREVLFFAPDFGPSDVTHISCERMAKPLFEHVKERLGGGARGLFGADATKAGFLAAIRGRRPAFVYSASHGMGLIGESLERQRRINGAICCQHGPGGLTEDDLLTADDLPAQDPFMEGGIFFQFACFGYGTPARSDFAHWVPGMPSTYASSDFVAELPKRLLAHPRGPIAFIGHLDTAFLHAFADPDDLRVEHHWHERIAPFLQAVDGILEIAPTALAMEDMNDRYNLYNALIANTYDRIKRGSLKESRESRERLAQNWIMRSDAQNYMVLGDPAARIRIPD